MDFLNTTFNKNDYRPTISENELSDADVLREIARLKNELKEQVVILGHHYQQDDIISFADYTGDSLQLAQIAAKLQHEHIIFCGVHFMAETADMLTKDNQHVMLPDLKAGCSMADMAEINDVERAFSEVARHGRAKVIPITYINCAANLKAFVGKNGGSICTSSNAKKMIQWAFTQGEKLFFFPDQHLGRNTCYQLGVKLDEMVVYNPALPQGGLSAEQIKNARVILWHGHCSVHQGFTLDQIKNLRKNDPQMQIIVHPECNYDVVFNADDFGSTSYILNKIASSPKGSRFAVGTEINLVNRIAQQFPDKKIVSLSPYQCLCTTMYRIRPRWLLAGLRSISENRPINIIKVEEDIKVQSLVALERMLSLS